jgi:regulator of sigma E protease
MELATPGFIYTLVMFLVLLSVLVFVHEWGHFAVARRFGVKVDIFSIGFGPELFGWHDKHGTRWKISWIPLGGYVKFFGDAGASSNPDDDVLDGMSEADKAQSFHHKPLAQKAAIVAAGPLINFAFAIVVFAGLYMALGEPYSSTEITVVAEGSGAYEAGLIAGDRIIAVNGDAISRFDELQIIVGLNTGEELLMTILRGEETLILPVVPQRQLLEDRFGNQFEMYRIGVSSGPIEIAELGVFESVIRATTRTAELTQMMLITTGQIISGVRSLDEMGGPIRIAQFSGQRASLGIISFISFMALISINLGLVNLFPIPMLDGGHLMFYGLEAIKGKPVSARVQEMSFVIGMTLVLGLMVLLTWNDLNSFEVWDRIGQFFS